MGQNSFIKEADGANINTPQGKDLQIFRQEGVARNPPDPNAPFHVKHPDGTIEPIAQAAGAINPFIVGNIDASTNPNYPAASAGEGYRIIVSGKIGGAAGIIVEAGDQDPEDGDIIYAMQDNPGGTQAAVGDMWTIWEGEEIRTWGRGTGANAVFQRGSNVSANASGVDSVAAGNSIASNTGSTAFGHDNTVSGANGFSSGFGNTASGNNSHVEGGANQATNESAHAEGSNTIASGENSHSEGNTTQAVGNGSHAEGNATVASGVNSHAEGDSNNAVGDNSHSEGSTNDSIGINSHTEGLNNDATGQNSHAQGSGTVASGNNSHSGGANEGGAVAASGNASFNHSVGLEDLPTDAAGNASAVLGGRGNNVGVAAISSANIGGDNNLVSASFSVNSGGENNIISGANSHIAAGQNNTVSGDSSAVSNGINNVASGDHSNAGGEISTASGLNSRAYGSRAEATGINSFASGIGTVAVQLLASGLNSFIHCEADEIKAEASGNNSSVLGGVSNNAEGARSGIFSGLENGISDPTSVNSTIIGGNTNLIVLAIDSSIIGGNNNTLLGDRSVMLGGTGRTELVDDYANAQNLRVTALQEFADDAAAVLGGLTSGAFYKTTGGGSSVVKVVA